VPLRLETLVNRRKFLLPSSLLIIRATRRPMQGTKSKGRNARVSRVLPFIRHAIGSRINMDCALKLFVLALTLDAIESEVTTAYFVKVFLTQGVVRRLRGFARIFLWFRCWIAHDVLHSVNRFEGTGEKETPAGF